MSEQKDAGRRVADRLAAQAGKKAIDSMPRWAAGAIGSALGIALSLVIVAWAVNFDAGRIGEMTVQNEVEIKRERVKADAANEQSALGTIQSLVTELVRQNGELIQGSADTLKAAKDTREIATLIIPRVAKLEADYLLLSGLPARVSALERQMGIESRERLALKRQVDQQKPAAR